MVAEVIHMKKDDQSRQVDSGQNTPKNSEGVGTSQHNAESRTKNKKWMYPAMYLAAAAIIFSLIWGLQGDDKAVVTDEELGMNVGQEEEETSNPVTGEVEDPLAMNDPDNMPATVSQETMIWPVATEAGVHILRPFYELSDSAEDKQLAMIEYPEGEFSGNTGITLGTDSGESFSVMAVQRGTVTNVDQLPVVGNLVEITHEDGLITVYQSLDEVTVQIDDEVMQGQVIAQSGRSEYGKDLGAHLQFELYQDGEPVNPENFLSDL